LFASRTKAKMCAQRRALLALAGDTAASELRQNAVGKTLKSRGISRQNKIEAVTATRF
jgi:hypothetical protein